MIFQFSANAWEDYLFWQETDRKTLRRINRLLEEAARSPSEGIGKPEPLRHNLTGWWSRHIDEEHRMVYRVKGDVLEIAQLRHHYD
jgi:toxin YoeB